MATEKGSIEKIEAAIVTTAKEVVKLKAVYDYPVFALGKKLPALLVLYDGFNQSSGPHFHTENNYNFEFTLYMPFEGTSAKKDWTALKALVPKVLDKFRANPGLGGTCWSSIIESGAPIIDIPSDPRSKPKFIGHSFRLVAHREENP